MTQSASPTARGSRAPHVHILGVAGTFMGGIAAIAKSLGFRVTGSDANVYPPMSTQLQALGIELIQGYGAEQLDLGADMIIVGNAMSRGKPVVEAMLDRGLAYTSGPQWLGEQVLRGRHVIAVAGTHGKTTTSSMIAWILESAGRAPGFLIGGVPANFEVTARLGSSPYFVIEADEYDTAFFDKRAKFVHYRPRTAVLNNLEYDHADIYPNLAAIRWQFHQLLRMVPATGRLIVNGEDAELAATLEQGCWTPVESFYARAPGAGAASASASRTGAPAAAARWHAARDAGGIELFRDCLALGTLRWDLLGEHNVMNALAAVAAAAQAGVAPAQAIEALGKFRGVKRRMEVRGCIGGVTVYDDFAHHPTAIRTTLEGLRARVGAARILAVLEPRSNTMKLGVHKDQLADALAAADAAWFYAPPNLGWDLPAQVAKLGARAHFGADVPGLAADVAQAARNGDHVLIMSNGGFGGLHDVLLQLLRKRS
ncbi:MAG: UDP-N-acetylmuramate:L-alanyl-gamma-D-glutamyl-meso-diaminopimelate ligase [Proteobacteria bacterium]|nr:UDP-N-acetylmuramate:L-alanyl-gamma-D-glutamyl-meso-diaminopimelate ligase [Pseudomonadota bacterium]